uniref:Uncharacterized protein n=1 Tax=Glossina austeni TaxID=7395 RepID=A0A1A9V7T0_GLOAU
MISFAQSTAENILTLLSNRTGAESFVIDNQGRALRRLKRDRTQASNASRLIDLPNVKHEKESTTSQHNKECKDKSKTTVTVTAKAKISYQVKTEGVCRDLRVSVNVKNIK